MQVKEILDHTKITFSFEFFPPRTEKGWDHLFLNISSLRALAPSWVSVTCGAGGATRENTHRLVMRINSETDLSVLAHLVCAGSTHTEIHAVLQEYAAHGIDNILALRGDNPLESSRDITPAGFPHAVDLVAYIKKHFPNMCIGVAGFPEGHPATPNRIVEMDYLKAKVDAGADYIITQLFFDNRDFYDFRERCELAGIRAPIIAGIMPVLSRAGMLRIAEIALGARIPARLIKAVSRADTDDHVGKVGAHWATEQVRDLIDNQARGIHFYTLNTARATLKIYESLGVSDSSRLRDERTHR
jgi:methylenetetrahydrofolate reductase (NADPH)